MARGINKVILIGNCGGDPETRYTPSGAAVTNITVATTESWKDKQSGEQKENTEWHRVIFWNRLAEIAGEYLRKGSKVYIEGRLQTRKWQAQDGSDRWTTEIVANEMQMLDTRGGSGSQQEEGQGGGSQQQAPRAAQPRPQAAAPASAPAPGAAGAPAPEMPFDDDIPF